MKPQRQNNQTPLIVSDLDGTLLDHHSYDFSAASPALQRLKQAGVAVVLNTSKTTKETLTWHQKLQLDTPYAVENGAALIGCDGTPQQTWGRPRADILELLYSLRKEHGWAYQGFNDLGIEGICQHTGLVAEAAERALARDWSEPLVWHDTQDALLAFRTQLENAGLNLLRGGRFFHVQGPHNKATPLATLRDLIDNPLLIAFGDGQNDAAMLTASDFAIRVRSPVNSLPEIAADTPHFDTQGMGPQGWQEAIDLLFEQGVLNDE